MKPEYTIYDHPDVAEWVRVNDALTSKLRDVEATIIELGKKLDDPLETVAPSFVEQALALTPGKHAEQVSPHNEIRQRLDVLHQQQFALQQALARHADRYVPVFRRGAAAAFGHVGETYLSLANRLCDLVAELASTNAALSEERKRLYREDIHAGSIPDILFPAFGLHEQLPMWARDLRDQVDMLAGLVRQAQTTSESIAA